jgi:outer membrane autotransporter protein
VAYRVLILLQVKWVLQPRISAGRVEVEPAVAACQATQIAAQLVADPDTPSSVREAAAEVLENNLLAIAPDETTAIAVVAPILATGQFDNLAARVAELRTADMGGTISTGGLTLLSNGIPISLASLAVLNQTDDPQSERNEERRTLLGGTRLGMWLNGNLGSSESDRRESNSGFESDTWNITGGVDYRFTDQFFAGAALGFSSLDADYSNDQGSLDADSRSVHVYSGYAMPNGFSFDGSVSYLRSDYTQKRVIEIMQLDGSGTGMQSLGRDIATGKPSVDQYGFSFGVTYTIMHGTWTIAPQAQFALVRTRYEAFQETGPSDFNLRYEERNNNNRSLSVGAYVDRTFATSVGAFRPYLRAYYFADNGASNDLITSFVQANDDGGNETLTLSMIEPDNRYGTAEMGLGFSRPIGTRTVDFNVGYLQTFSFQDLNRWALRFDVRIPL